jgi:hypothetical protein
MKKGASTLFQVWDSLPAPAPIGDSPGQALAEARGPCPFLKLGDSPANLLINQGGYGHTTRAPPGASLPSGFRTRNLQILDPAFKPLRCSGDKHLTSFCLLGFISDVLWGSISDVLHLLQRRKQILARKKENTARPVYIAKNHGPRGISEATFSWHVSGKSAGKRARAE